MREIEFRGRSKLTKKWVYGSLIVKKEKRITEELDKELFDYKYSIQYRNKNGNYKAIEVIEDTIGQLVGIGEYGRIYEGMELWDEYAYENCSIEYDEEECAFRLVYDSYTERIDNLDGLRIIDEELLEKGKEE